MKKIILLLAFIPFIFGCNQKKEIFDEVYETSVKLTDEIIQTYLKLDKINTETKFRENLTKILSDKGADTIDFNPVLLNKKDVEIFIVYKNFLIVAHNVENGNNALNINDLKIAALSVLNLIDSLKGDSLKEQTDQIRRLLSTPKIDKNVLLYRITQIVADVYHYDVEQWINSIDSAYNTYYIMVKNIPNSVFDIQKLQKYVYEPYKGDDKLIEIYKQNLRQEAIIFKNKFKDRITGAYVSLRDLQDIFLEMTNRTPDPMLINYKLARIKAFSEQEKQTDDAK